MERRNDARDSNRPQLNVEDTDVDEVEDDQWTEESNSSEDRKKEPKAFSHLNDSIKQKKIHEEFLKKQQKVRVNRFSLNRRKSKEGM